MLFFQMTPIRKQNQEDPILRNAHSGLGKPRMAFYWQ